MTTADAGGNYTLVGQTHFAPPELRFHEMRLTAGRRIAFRRGDLLGLQFVRYSPVTWSSVPCAEPAQRPLVSRRVGGTPLTVGSTLKFDVGAAEAEYLACRQYSFTAVLGQSTALSRNC